MFLIFIRACIKYRFTFALSTYGGISLRLRPNNTFENIKVNEKHYNSYNFYNFYKLLLKAIRIMKKYREESR